MSSARPLAAGRPAGEGVLLRAVSLWLLAAAVFLGVGYLFPDPDHHAMLAGFRAYWFPELYPHDFAMENYRGFTHRTPLYEVFGALTQLGLGEATLMLTLYLVALVAALAGFLALAAAAGITAPAVVLWIAMAAFCVHSGTLGLTYLWTGGLRHSSVAIAFALWAWWALLRGRWIAGGALLALAAQVQVLLAVHAALVIAPYAAWQAWRTGTLARAAWGAALLAVSVGLLFALMDHAAYPADAPASFFQVYAVLRLPTMMLPSRFYPIDYWCALWLYAAAVLALVRLRPPWPGFRVFAASGLAVVALGFVANLVLVEGLHIAFFTKLQFARLTPYGELIALLILGVFAQQLLAAGRRADALTLGLALLLPWALPALLWAVWRRPDLPRGPWAWAVTAATLAVGLASAWPRYALYGAVLLMLPLLAERLWPRRHLRLALTAGLALLLTALQTLAGLGRLPAGLQHRLDARLRFDADRGDPLRQVAEAAGRATPCDALFLIPPQAVGFRFHSRRSVVVDQFVISHTMPGIAEWARRMSDVLGEEFLANRQVAFELRYGRPIPEMLEVARRYGATHILIHHDDTGQVPASLGPPLLDEGEWLVWPVPPTPTSP